MVPAQSDKITEMMSGNILTLLGEDTALWDAQLYPVCKAQDEAVPAALVTYRMMKGIASVEEKEQWLSWEKISLKESFLQADVTAACTVILVNCSADCSKTIFLIALVRSAPPSSISHKGIVDSDGSAKIRNLRPTGRAAGRIRRLTVWSRAARW